MVMSEQCQIQVAERNFPCRMVGYFLSKRATAPPHQQEPPKVACVSIWECLGILPEVLEKVFREIGSPALTPNPAQVAAPATWYQISGSGWIMNNYFNL